MQPSVAIGQDFFAKSHHLSRLSKFKMSQSPESLAGTLYHRDALFGKIPFGETIVRNLYYTKRPLCNGQTPGTPDSIKSGGYFLMVERGDCSFVEKIRNAQRENATAVIIADNTCLCSVAGSCDAEEECEELEPTMDDDGSGTDSVRT